jgi:hypothetical protein
MQWMDRVGATGERNRGEATVRAWEEAHGGVAILDNGDAGLVAQRNGLEVHGTLWLLAGAARERRWPEPAIAGLVDTLIANGARYPASGANFSRWAPSTDWPERLCAGGDASGAASGTTGTGCAAGRRRERPTEAAGAAAAAQSTPAVMKAGELPRLLRAIPAAYAAKAAPIWWAANTHPNTMAARSALATSAHSAIVGGTVATHSSPWKSTKSTSGAQPVRSTAGSAGSDSPRGP